MKYFDLMPVIVDHTLKTDMVIDYDNPLEVGADRIVNGVAAYRKYGGPIIIVDYGTATTFCAIDADCHYLGGAIVPGIKVSSDALTNNAAKLSRVELETTEQIICTNTTASIQSGIIHGNVGASDYLIDKMWHELGCPDDMPVIATGGLATMIADLSTKITVVDRNLTLEGLHYLYILNRDHAQATAL